MTYQKTFSAIGSKIQESENLFFEVECPENASIIDADIYFDTEPSIRSDEVKLGANPHLSIVTNYRNYDNGLRGGSQRMKKRKFYALTKIDQELPSKTCKFLMKIRYYLYEDCR